MSDLGIVIVNYNTCELLRDCLASIANSVDAPRYRVLVVDNGSSDDSAAMVHSEFPWVQLIVSQRNGGYAYANNLGLRALGFDGGAVKGDARPRYVLLLNPDTVLPPEALAAMTAYLEDHPDVGAVGPKLVRRDGSLDKACRRSFPSPAVSFYHFAGLDRLFPHSARFGRYNLSYLDPDLETEVDALVGAFMLLRAEALERAGLLDERFFMYGEDIDLCYRIKQRGWRIVYYPRVTVLHIKGASSRKASRRAIAALYDAMKIFHDKHYRARTCFLVNWGIDLGIALLRHWALFRDHLRPAERKRVASA